MQTINCPLCNGRTFKKLFYKDEMNVVGCQKCGLIFTNPQLAQKELSAHYDKNYYCCPNKDPKDNSRYRDYNARYLRGKEGKRFGELLAKLDVFFPLKGKLLDVGCASGFYIAEANKKGWKAEGVEISKWAADWGKKNLGVKIFNGELKQGKFKTANFDVVTFLDCFEHLRNPLTELKETARILKKNGIIYIETINFDSFITRHLIGSKYVHMVPRFHLYYFGRKQLISMLAKAGFKTLFLELTSSSVGDYEHRGLEMYWSYIKLLINPPKEHKNFALNDLIRIYAQKI